MIAASTRRGATLLASMAIASTAAPGCGSQPPTEPDAKEARTTRVDLPRAVFPRFLAFSGDGSLWVSESSADAIARVTPDRRISHHRLGGSETSVGDIVEGPDGAMWFQGFLLLGRVDERGDFSFWANFGSRPQPAVGLPAAIAAGPDDALWFTDEGVPPEIGRITTWGAIEKAQIPSGDGGLDMAGIAAGPDGALWFTQAPEGDDDPSDAIGRMTTDFEYESWTLPRRGSRPTRIAAGPDGALWFSERAGRIGRITTEGRISEFPLKPGLSPFDITSGKDGAVWFTTDKRIGRITTAGRIRTWRIPEAEQLIGIAAAPDGSFWLADGQGDAVHHFRPPR